MFYWMLMPYRRYVDFTGRSQRMEYWMFLLFSWIVLILGGVLTFSGLPWAELMAQERGGPQVTASPGTLTWLGLTVVGVFWLASLVPTIAVTVRRFHDQDKTGWLYLLNFVPYIGPIVVLVFMCIEGTRGPNAYGDDPKDPHSTEVFA